MDKSYLDYLLSEWANYHYHTQISSIGFKKVSSTYVAGKALEMEAVIHSTAEYIDNTPDYINKIDKALDELTVNLRQVITIEYLGKGRRKDKVKKMNITSEAYSVRLNRARRQLMNVLGE